MISPRKTVSLAVFSLVLGGLFAVGWAERERPKKSPPMAPGFYHQDADHPWNRVHETLFVRIGPDEKRYGQDRLEPLLWNESQYLLKGAQAELALKVLEEFQSTRGESRIDDPLKRAILQRDLWLVANWLADRPKADSERWLGLLAQAIHRLALTPEEIAKLPDNYQSAVKSKEFAKAFDPGNPKRAYLPLDMFQAEGPWVCVGRTDGRTAPGHLSGPHNLIRPGKRSSFTNSVFFVFLKVPGGREAGLAFLKTLAAETKPMFVPTFHEDGRITSGPNLDLPKLPIGSELALVRKAMLIDPQGQIVLSPLTESVQLRVTTSEIIPQADGGGLQEDPKRAAAFEFEFRRADLFAEKAIGLKDVSEEKDFITGAYAGAADEFEVNRKATADHPGHPPFEAPSVMRRESCFGCHGVSTFYGTRSFQRYWTYGEERNRESPPMYPVASMPMKAVEAKTLEWKRQDPAWLRLRKLLPE